MPATADRYTYDDPNVDLPTWHPDHDDYREPVFEEVPMKYPVKGGGADYKRVPPGSHIAVCNMVVDLGLQPGSQAFPKPKQQVYLRFEVPEERTTYTDRDGNEKEGPMTIGVTFTASMHKKATLRKALETWRSKAFTDEEAGDFDVAAVLSRGCMLSVSETERDGKTYSNISNISPLPKGVPAPRPENDVVYYGPDKPGAFNKLPEWLQKKVQAQLDPTEHKADDRDDPSTQHYSANERDENGQRMGDEPFRDEIPF